MDQIRRLLKRPLTSLKLAPMIEARVAARIIYKSRPGKRHQVWLRSESEIQEAREKARFITLSDCARFVVKWRKKHGKLSAIPLSISILEKKLLQRKLLRIRTVFEAPLLL